MEKLAKLHPEYKFEVHKGHERQRATI
jgi:hypothetical protein